MSTKKEKCRCCDGECNHDACCGKIEENCATNCPCHQSESIELAEEIAGKVTDIIFNREAGWSGVLELYLSEKLSQATAAAVAKRELEIAEELRDLPGRTVSIGRVLQIIQS